MIENESHKKEADLRALQAQINPHFLYNTLSSIQWIALMNEETASRRWSARSEISCDSA